MAPLSAWPGAVCSHQVVPHRAVTVGHGPPPPVIELHSRQTEWDIPTWTARCIPFSSSVWVHDLYVKFIFTDVSNLFGYTAVHDLYVKFIFTILSAISLDTLQYNDLYMSSFFTILSAISLDTLQYNDLYMSSFFTVHMIFMYSSVLYMIFMYTAVHDLHVQTAVGPFLLKLLVTVKIMCKKKSFSNVQ